MCNFKFNLEYENNFKDIVITPCNELRDELRDELHDELRDELHDKLHDELLYKLCHKNININNLCLSNIKLQYEEKKYIEDLIESYKTIMCVMEENKDLKLKMAYNYKKQYESLVEIKTCLEKS